MTVHAYCKEACEVLRNCKSGHEFAVAFCDMKQEFFRLYQDGQIFSTRFGADFFEEVGEHILSRKPLVAPEGEKLGEFDQSFNAWLKKLPK